jgi:hypothetical protein
MTSPRLQGQHFLEIHEFSTGIYADGNYDDWISRGFTGAYMNATIDPIPNIIEMAIANGLFQTVGGLPHQPAIIGRVLQGKNEQWSVVAVVTIGKDGKGRSLSVFRYFLAEGIESISAIVAWLEESHRQNGKFSIFNPFEIKQFGDVHKVNIEIPEPMPLGLADLNWLNEPLSSVTRTTSQVSLQDINDLAYAKSQLNQKPISWAYNIYSLKQPNRFQVIHPVNDASRLMVQQQLDYILKPQSIAHSNSSSDSKLILRGLISSSELRSDQIEEFVLLLSDPNQDWQQIFDSLGAIDALSKKIYVPNMIRLIALQSIAIPHTLMTVLDWLRIDDKRQRQQNQQIFFNLQWQLRPYIDDVRGNLILGIVELIISLYSEAVIGNFTNSSKYIFNYLWLLDAKDSLWSSLKDEVITAFLEKVLVSAKNRIPSDQAWQDFIQPLLTANSTVNRSTLAQPVGWRDFYVGIRDYADGNKNPKYVYIAELFEQLGSGQKKSFLSKAKEFILGVSQLFIFIIAIILVTIFDVSFAANIPKEFWLVSMFAPLAGLAGVSLITRSFISAWLVGIPHIIFIKWRLCLDVISHGWATAAIWTFLMSAIWLICEAAQSLKKSNAINRDAYTLAAVFYKISYGTVSQNVFDNAVKSGYTSNQKVQGFSIASAKTIDDSLIRIVKKIQLQGVIIGLSMVAVIFALVLVTHKFFEFTKRPSPFAPILSYNPNCAFPPPSEIGNWETTRKEIKSIVDENIQGDNKSKALYSLLDTLGGERLVGNVDEKSKYFYKGAIEEARQDPKLIQNWTDLIFTYQISKQKDFPDIIASGSISRGDRTSELLRNDLRARLNAPNSSPNPNGTVEINQTKIDAMFREVQQDIDGALRSETRAADTSATQQKILHAIKDLLPPLPPSNTKPLQYPIRDSSDLSDWRYDINRYLTGSPDKLPTAKQWQDFKNTVIQKVRQPR